METIRDLILHLTLRALNILLISHLLMKYFVQKTSARISSEPTLLWGPLLTIDHDVHFERRRLQAPLFRKEALEYYEHEELLPLINAL